MVGGQGRKTNRRHVASRSKTAKINAPADTTAVCLSHNRVHTLGPNTAARPQTPRQALTLRSSMSQPCDKTRLLAVNTWISPVRRGWVQIFLQSLGSVSGSVFFPPFLFHLERVFPCPAAVGVWKQTTDWLSVFYWHKNKQECKVGLLKVEPLWNSKRT